MSKLRIAIVGCGAVAERGHLPAAMRLDNVDVAVLIDRDLDRARQLAKKFSVAEVATDIEAAIGSVDAAIVALPHNLHAPVCSRLLKAGIHTLVEKPMALTLAECELMERAAAEGNAVLAVGLMRRFLHSAMFVKTAIENGLIGKIRSFDLREGNVYNWPVSSDSFLRPETAGGGVLFDTGAHTLDLALWWLGDLDLVEYRDDSFGGVEADSLIRLRTSSGVEGSVHLSRTRNLRNTAIITGERGTIEVDLRKNHATVRLAGDDGAHDLVGYGRTENLPDEPDQGFTSLFLPQLEDFVRAAQQGGKPRCAGEQAKHSIALIEQCYARRQPLELPWLAPRPEVALPDLKGKRVLVTGGTGFIGGRLVESLVLDHQAEVRVLVRNYSRASRVARFPLEFIAGDIVDEETVDRAVTGCDYVFHCAYDFAGHAQHKEKVSVRGTENICKSALRHGVKRVVHLSTFSVYGNAEGPLDETSAKVPDGDVYAETKLAAENLVLTYAQEKKLPAVILQPTIVYGPFSRPWTVNPFMQLSSGTVLLPKDGAGLCNAVYIDDVVDAICNSAVASGVDGETILISGRQPVTWEAFYGALEAILGRKATAPMTVAPKGASASPAGGKPARKGLIADMLAIVRDPYVKAKIGSVPAVQRIGAGLRERTPSFYKKSVSIVFGKSAPDAPGRPEAAAPVVHVPDRTRYELLTSTASVDIGKANKLIAYKPAYDLSSGMKITEYFLRWAAFAEEREVS